MHRRGDDRELRALWACGECVNVTVTRPIVVSERVPAPRSYALQRQSSPDVPRLKALVLPSGESSCRQRSRGSCASRTMRSLEGGNGMQLCRVWQNAINQNAAVQIDS